MPQGVVGTVVRGARLVGHRAGRVVELGLTDGPVEFPAPSEMWLRMMGGRIGRSLQGVGELVSVGDREGQRVLLGWDAGGHPGAHSRLG